MSACVMRSQDPASRINTQGIFNGRMIDKDVTTSRQLGLDCFCPWTTLFREELSVN